MDLHRGPQHPGRRRVRVGVRDGVRVGVRVRVRVRIGPNNPSVSASLDRFVMLPVGWIFIAVLNIQVGE